LNPKNPAGIVEITMRTVIGSSVIVETIKARRFHLDYYLYDAFMNYCFQKEWAKAKRNPKSSPLYNLLKKAENI
jgi:hypothetical protein